MNLQRKLIIRLLILLTATLMRKKMQQMWAAKLGLSTFDAPLFNELKTLMTQPPR
jgi:hypothetical protein